MIQSNSHSASSAPITIGKYRIAVLPAAHTAGRFSAQVSIASGKGSASTDRVMRFTPNFQSSDAPAQYALKQAIRWALSPKRVA